MNNRKVVPGAGVTHMLSTILAKVNRIEQLLSPNIENLPDSEILDSKGVRLLTKMSDRTLLNVAMTARCPFTATRERFTTAVRTCCVPCYWKRKNTLKIKGYEKDDQD